ncbi:MAG: glycosyltransferase [Acidobacteriota bacterium]
MRVVALLAVRNEELYLERCLEHLCREGIETLLIDNGSTDATRRIATEFLSRGVIAIEDLPFSGAFELEPQLRRKEQLAREIEADWFIHCDADEIRQAPGPHATLSDAISAMDREGYNAIDFDEFVFLPTAEDDSFEGRDYVAEMRSYYYYEPDSPDRYRINAWRKNARIDLHTFAGHRVVFPGLRVAPDPFILRHYIALSGEHARRKYGARRFSPREIANSWHRDRASFRGTDLVLPKRAQLKWLGQDERFDKNEPRTTHPLFSAAPQSTGLAALLQFRNDHAESIPSIAPIEVSVARPFWSVVIPTFNPVRSFLIAALESVLAEDEGGDHMQIAVIDDGSTTGDVETLVGEVGRGRIEFFSLGRNHGLAGAWNACIEYARGDWIHILHQDDRILKDFYSRFELPCRDEPGIVAAFCRAGGLDESGAVAWVQQPERETPGTLSDFVAKESATNRIMTPSIVVRRAAYEVLGGYHAGLPYCLDWDMYKRLSVYGQIWYEPSFLACYRQHSRSQTSQLKGGGADLEDRRRSVALSKAYLPPSLEARVSNVALKTSIIWATDILREAVLKDDYSTALAQTREILTTLAQITSASVNQCDNVNQRAANEGQAVPFLSGAAATEELWARIESLEGQVRAWTNAAADVQQRYQRLQQRPEGQAEDAP